MRLPTVAVQTDVLDAWLRVTGSTKSQLAVQLDVSKGRVSQLFTDHVEPSAHLIAKLLVVTNLPFDRLFRIAAHAPQPNGNGSAHHGKAKRSEASHA